MIGSDGAGVRGGSSLNTSFASPTKLASPSFTSGSGGGQQHSNRQQQQSSSSKERHAIKTMFLEKKNDELARALLIPPTDKDGLAMGPNDLGDKQMQDFMLHQFAVDLIKHRQSSSMIDSLAGTVENLPLAGRDDADLNIGVGILMLAGDGKLRKCREKLHPKLLETLGMESLAADRMFVTEKNNSSSNHSNHSNLSNHSNGSNGNGNGSGNGNKCNNGSAATDNNGNNGSQPAQPTFFCCDPTLETAETKS